MSTGSLDSGEVRIAPFGHVYVGPLGATMPTGVTAPLGSEFADVGYLTEDGVQITPSTDSNDINAWQSASPVKIVQTTVGLELQFTMEQTNQDSTGLFLFGDDWTGDINNVASLVLSSNPDLNEVALVVEWDDDEDNTNRLLVPRCVVTDRQAIQLVRTDAVKYGVTMRVLDSNGTLATWLSDNPDVLPAS
jgi:hypothetical protein